MSTVVVRRDSSWNIDEKGKLTTADLLNFTYWGTFVTEASGAASRGRVGGHFGIFVGYKK